MARPKKGKMPPALKKYWDEKRGKKASSKKGEERKESKATERKERKAGAEKKGTRKAPTKRMPKTAGNVSKKRISQEKKSIAKRRKSGKFTPVKRPGAATAKAKKEGLSVQAWAKKHYHDSGKTGEEARFVVDSKKWDHGGTKKSSKA